VPDYVTGPAKSDWHARLALFEGNQETLYRIHRTNQPEYIGQAISSGFIRIANGDVIDQAPR
jgi:lipoprotein-anchoring transpeptidase ErfK/SrfK